MIQARRLGTSLIFIALIAIGLASATCGDGVVDAGETCDFGSYNGACPTACSTSCQVNSCATGSCQIGVSKVACNPINNRLIIVGSGGNYSTIQGAVAIAQAGDTILVKNGTYTGDIEIWASGSSSNSITLANYPGHKPVIKPGYGASEPSIDLRGNWITVSGFEVTEGYRGFTVYGDNNKIEYNYIHDNGNESGVSGEGITVVSADQLLIRNNTIESNGRSAINDSLPAHGIYLSDYYYNWITNVTIVNNTISDHAGAGIQSYIGSIGGAYYIAIRNNQFINNTYEMLFVRMYDSYIAGNTITHKSHPPLAGLSSFTNKSVIWTFEQSNNNDIGYNTIHDELKNGTKELVMEIKGSSDIQNWDYNTSEVRNETKWKVVGTYYNNFIVQYPMTSADPHGTFVNLGP